MQGSCEAVINWSLVYFNFGSGGRVLKFYKKDEAQSLLCVYGVKMAEAGGLRSIIREMHFALMDCSTDLQQKTFESTSFVYIQRRQQVAEVRHSEHISLMMAC